MLVPGNRLCYNSPRGMWGGWAGEGSQEAMGTKLSRLPLRFSD